MRRPRVSIVLPVRDAEATVAQAVTSCLQQSFTDIELLVVLNGCSDRTAEVVQEVVRGDPRVTILESAAEEGVTGAMQAGMAAAQAPLVARMDADDVAQRERIARQVVALEEDPSIDAVSCGVRLVGALGEGMARYVEWVNGLVTPEAVARERFVECPVIQPSLMMRKASVALAGGYRQVEWAEDHDLFLRMLRGGARLGKVGEVLLEWRDGEKRLTRTDPAYAGEQVWRMKAHHLAQEPLVREHGVAICGAGPIGKRLGRLLRAEGIAVRGYFDVHPRRIGARIGGVEVADPEECGSRWREAVLLSAVGVAGGRERVRELAGGAGYVEGEDFWCCC